MIIVLQDAAFGIFEGGYFAEWFSSFINH